MYHHTPAHSLHWTRGAGTRAYPVGLLVARGSGKDRERQRRERVPCGVGAAETEMSKTAAQNRRRKAAMVSHDAMTSLVDVKKGLISREIFVNDDLYQQEQEQVFARAWLFVGHESQI